MSTTYKPKKRKRARAHGFLSRQKTSTGKRTIRNRRRKSRKRLSV
ncbi:MAG: 50S ribosomal protein L34 [Candidatus Zambryskibacteria bacterium]|nr:50S ribosomal protein L34 [Candidatus Zambryskibacteria bacterium]